MGFPLLVGSILQGTRSGLQVDGEKARSEVGKGWGQRETSMRKGGGGGSKWKLAMGSNMRCRQENEFLNPEAS